MKDRPTYTTDHTKPLIIDVADTLHRRKVYERKKAWGIFLLGLGCGMICSAILLVIAQYYAPWIVQ